MSHIRIKFHVARAAATPLLSTGLLPPEPAAGQNTTGPAMEAGAHDERGHDARDVDQRQFEVSGNGEPVDRSIEIAAAGADADKLDQGWQLARQAALDSIQGNPGQNVFYAVFTIHATSGGYTEFAAKPGGIKTVRAEATTFIVEPQS